MGVIELIYSVLTPVALVSGTGLIALSVQNRYGRVVDRLRSFSKELSEANGLGKREVIVKAQMEILLRRGVLLRNALFSLYLAVFFTLLSSVFVLISTYWEITLIASLAFFVFALITLMVGMVIVLIEVVISYSAVRNEALETMKINAF